MMKNRLLSYVIAAFMFLAAACDPSRAEGLLDRLYTDLMNSCVSMDYTYSTMVSGARLSGNGTILLQGNMWRMSGNGVDMWCDGSLMWTVDQEAKEVVIDVASDDSPVEIMSNPATLFADLQKWFSVEAERNTSDGKAVLYMLKPVEDIDIEYVNVELLKTDGSLRSGSFAMNDGNEVSIRVSSMKVMPKKHTSAFRPYMSFDSSWIVTDMR